MDNFTDDKDLKFLYNCSNDNLKLLVEFVIFDKDGKKRWSTKQSTGKDFDNAYNTNNIKAILPIVIDELQRYGGNSFFNIFRGHGVSYKKILIKVCKQNKVNFNKDASAELLEKYLLQKILLIAVEKMTDEDVKHLSESQTKDLLIKNITKFHIGDPLILKMVTTAVIQIAKRNGLKTLGGFAARFAGGKAFSLLTGPIGWGLAGLWTLFDIAGPAYRVMIPATITIAYLRIISNKTEEELNNIFN